jgi:purine-nucleoside phosphorylase
MSDVEKMVQFIRSKISGKPEIGIICGSGLAHLSKTLTEPVTVPYSSIPGFPKSTVEGHHSELVFGNLGGKYTMCLRGRFHFYEGYSPSVVSLPVRLMAALGCKFLVITNAAGGINPNYNIGDLMVIKSHIGLNTLAGINPLIGPNDERFGPRFFPQHYDEAGPQLLQSCAQEIKFKNAIHQGVYVGCAGPSYETPAEISFMRAIRGDAVGMSTVFELVEAFHCGLRFIGISLVTNKCKSLDDHFSPPSHKEVLEAVDASATEVQRLVATFVTRLDVSAIPPTTAARNFAARPIAKL